MAKKEIDYSKLTLKQVLFFFSGLAVAVFGMVMSIILFASDLYENGEEFPVSLEQNQPQVVCDACTLQDGGSVWLHVAGRQIEYTDIGITVSVVADDGTDGFQNNSTFKVVGLRNQTGGEVYYRLATPESMIGKKAQYTIQKSGADTLPQPSSIMFRYYGGININPLYIILMIVGSVLIFMSTRMGKK